MDPVAGAAAPDQGVKSPVSFKKRLKQVQKMLTSLLIDKSKSKEVIKYVLIPPSEKKMVKDCRPVLEKLSLKGRVTNYKFNNQKAFFICSLINIENQSLIINKESWKLFKLSTTAKLFLSNLPYLFDENMARTLGSLFGVVEAVDIPKDSDIHIGNGTITFSELHSAELVKTSVMNIADNRIFLRWSKETLDNLDYLVKKAENLASVPKPSFSSKSNTTMAETKAGSSKGKSALPSNRKFRKAIAPAVNVDSNTEIPVMQKNSEKSTYVSQITVVPDPSIVVAPGSSISLQVSLDHKEDFKEPELPQSQSTDSLSDKFFVDKIGSPRLRSFSTLKRKQPDSRNSISPNEKKKTKKSHFSEDDISIVEDDNFHIVEPKNFRSKSKKKNLENAAPKSDNKALINDSTSTEVEIC